MFITRFKIKIRNKTDDRTQTGYINIFKFNRETIYCNKTKKTFQHRILLQSTFVYVCKTETISTYLSHFSVIILAVDRKLYDLLIEKYLLDEPHLISWILYPQR